MSFQQLAELKIDETKSIYQIDDYDIPVFNPDLKDQNLVIKLPLTNVKYLNTHGAKTSPETSIAEMEKNIGSKLVIYKIGNNFIHPTPSKNNVSLNEIFQKPFEVGELRHVYHDIDENGNIYGNFTISAGTKQLFVDFLHSVKNNNLPLFVSHQIVGNANTEDITNIKKFRAQHFAMVDSPAWHKDLMHIKGMCFGDGMKCDQILSIASTIDFNNSVNKQDIMSENNNNVSNAPVNPNTNTATTVNATTETPKQNENQKNNVIDLSGLSKQINEVKDLFSKSNDATTKDAIIKTINELSLKISGLQTQTQQDDPEKTQLKQQVAELQTIVSKNQKQERDRSIAESFLNFSKFFEGKNNKVDEDKFNGSLKFFTDLAIKDKEGNEIQLPTEIILKIFDHTFAIATSKLQTTEESKTTEEKETVVSKASADDGYGVPNNESEEIIKTENNKPDPLTYGTLNNTTVSKYNTY